MERVPREGTVFPAMGMAGVPGRVSKATPKHWATMDAAASVQEEATATAMAPVLCCLCWQA